MTSNLTVGYSWDSNNGQRTIEEIDAEGRYFVRTSGCAWQDIHPNDADVLQRQTLDAANLAYRLECEAKQEAAAKAEAERLAPLTAFLATMPPMQAGKARVSLERSARWPGGRIEPRWKAILRLIGEGYVLDGRGLVAPNESYFGQDALTSHGLNFAKFHGA